MYKVIVAGSRTFNDYLLLEEKLDRILSKRLPDVEIVLGTADGADRQGELYANKNKLPIKRFPADWNTHGKKAGYLRNLEMAKYADACIVFWNGTSKGTKHMIDIANKHNLPLRIIRYTDYQI